MDAEGPQTADTVEGRTTRNGAKKGVAEGLVSSSLPDAQKRVRKPNLNRQNIQDWIEEENDNGEGEVEVVATPRSQVATGAPATPKAPTARAKKETSADKLDKLYKFMMRQEDKSKDQDKLIASLKKEVVELRKIVSELRDTVVERADLQQANTEELRVLVKSNVSLMPTTSYAAAASTPAERILEETTRPLPYRETTFRCSMERDNAAHHVTPGDLRARIEEEVQKKEGLGAWKPLAVLLDRRVSGRINVLCRTEEELALVKEALENTRKTGERVLRNQYHPVRVDGARRDVVLDHNNKIIPEVAEEMGRENGVNIAKIGWLSDRMSVKRYGSMVVYCTTSADAAKLLRNQYIYVGGESAHTNLFEKIASNAPIRCYQCQGKGHIAYRCTNAPRCGKCAEIGHSHRDCTSHLEKCCDCGGPHATFSNHCSPRDQVPPATLNV